MKVLTQPLTYVTGDVLAPEDLDRAWLYSRDAVADVAQRRWTKGFLTFPFVQDVATPYTNATTAELLSYRFTCPVTCQVERAFLSGNLTCTGDVQVNITKVSGGTTPTGATAPYLSTGGTIASASTDTADVNVDRVQLEAGAEYKITVSGTTFSFDRFDVTLQVAVDRWNVSGALAIPNFNPTLLTDLNMADATLVAANNTALATEAVKFASALTAPTPMLFVAHGFTSATDTDLLRFTVPRFSNVRGQAIVKRIYVYAVMSGTGGGTVTATLKSAGGSTLASASANVAGVTFASADSGALSVALTAAPTGTSADTSVDCRLEFANSSAGTSCLRAHAIVWIARA